MTTDQFALLRATAAVQRLNDDLTVRPGDPQRERTYLVHRAALADRAVPALVEVEDPATSEQDAADTRWDTDPRGYARQEHAAAVRDEHDQEHARA